MIVLKNQNKIGFSFIEIVMSIAIVGMLLISIFNLQSGLIRNIFDDHSRISRIFYIRNLFGYENYQKLKKEKVLKIDLKDPATNLIAQMQPTPANSEVTKRFENVYLIKATGSWTGVLGKQEETIIGFVHRPKKKKQK
jgi:hypothetical protein